VKPAVLVDVDGVLNAFFGCNKPRETCPCHPGWTRLWARSSTGRFRLTLNPAHGGMLRDLAHGAGADLVWATYWGEEANTWVSPTVGLPTDLPHVPIPECDDESTVGEWKALHVARWATGRPFVWFEDELDVPAALAGIGLPSPHLVVTVDAGAGLSPDDIERARTWLAAR
jgi:hypothetical protein